VLEAKRVPPRPGIPEFDLFALGPKTCDNALLIPVLNEGSRIRSQLARIQENHPEVDVFVADGGSTDDSVNPEWLVAHGVCGLLVKVGPGKLSAQVRMAMAYALSAGYRNILTMDGNDKDGVEGIDRIIKSLDAGNGFVQGSRFVPGGKAVNTPRTRTAGIRAIHAPLTSLAARARFTDTTNGFRGHSREFLLDPEVAPFRDVFDTYELLAYLPIRAGSRGYRTAEVPVTRSYPADGSVPTKIHGMRGNRALLSILIKAARGRYTPDAVEQAFAANRKDITVPHCD
jgi:dolichol-phosphate mannosyltransferase